MDTWGSVLNATLIGIGKGQMLMTYSRRKEKTGKLLTGDSNIFSDSRPHS